MSDQKEGKWLPYNQDGSVHDCNKQKNGNENNGLSLEVLLKSAHPRAFHFTADRHWRRNIGNSTYDDVQL
jgi:hypothetical protein